MMTDYYPSSTIFGNSIIKVPDNNHSQNCWLFAYGSLIWRADFSYVERLPAVASGFERRFWQGSTDHRGVPSAPGRVLTLSVIPDGHCTGIAYRLDSEQKEDILKNLDYREKGGYERRKIEISLICPDDTTSKVTGITYLAPPENQHYMGESSLENIAAQILASAGPSGSNLDYLFELEKELLLLNCFDHHIHSLCRVVRNKLAFGS